ncbi:class I SAM-dependent methyltransferase [Argonema antarcticum]|uniref:class I SAM-dependent methyltransferase n=1 Tax=Argonema antarcticum TaxID=2942763 RepID=UPI0020115B6F|nr:methyltransferase domain-containing protein [Argonema antarcticum]MCL1475354.1 methyltransferase domain-containing protein [Argonema antarcticum A004/B2]
MRENYTPGYSTNATDFMAQRTVESHGAFFIPHLYPGMKLLDCGCGPGTISLGLARIIFPGTVTGIDREISQINIAIENAKKQDISNADFIEGSIYNLPFPDNSFDAVFSHALFEHLAEPLKALSEIKRVLKPGGKVGIRSPDWGGFLIAPETPQLKEAIAFYQFIQQQNGGNPYVGRELKALLKKAGFSKSEFSASYQCYEPLSQAAEYLALRIEASEKIEGAPEKGWTSKLTLTQMAEGLREWSHHPDGIFAQAWCEAVGFIG